ncbi:hypothetical protein K1719_010448 [Acacia pycnantha]|nr:hypothetical protein K1719_010448 [Acacia pycnantha]
MTAPMVNVVTAMIEELRRLIQEELRGVSDGVNSKLANLEDLIRQLQAGAYCCVVCPAAGCADGDHRAHHATIDTSRRMRFGNWYSCGEDEIWELVQLRVQYPPEKPDNIWGTISTGMNSVRTRTACAKKWYSLLERYSGMVHYGIESIPDSYYHNIQCFLNPIAGD